MNNLEKLLDAFDESFKKVIIRPFDKILWTPFKKLVEKLFGRFL